MRLVAPTPELVTLSGFSLSVPRSKLVLYLLNPSHPDNKGKAGFFTHFGFAFSNPNELALRLAAQAFEAVDVRSEPHPMGYGVRVNVRGTIQTPAGASPTIRTAWRWNPGNIDDYGREQADFVTAFPD